MEERLRFVARFPDGADMSDVCRSFGILRKTNYKICSRRKEQGLEGVSGAFAQGVKFRDQRPTKL